MRFTDSFIADLRDRLPISEVIRTRVSWDAKKTNVQRGDFWGCCPFHGESRPSFHCEDRKGRYHCFGCGVTGDHFRFLMELDGVSFPRAIEMVAGLAGINLPDARQETAAERAARENRDRARKRQDEQRAKQDQRNLARKTDTVRTIWREAVPIEGTLAEKYLVSRSLLLDGRNPHLASWPASLRFHPALKLEGVEHPALIGGVQSVDRSLNALWRIFLDPKGNALLGEDGKKLKLGFGQAKGGAVRLGPVTATLRLAEGMETSLAVQRLTDNKASVWATLSTSGMIGFDIPSGVKRLEIYADGDRYRSHRKTGNLVKPPGIAAAESLRAKAIEQNIEAVIYPSPEPDDWLDVWEVRFKHDHQQRDIQYRD